MGAKITIDSATMMNKGLEIIEARWLFDVQPENIDVVVHRESIIHSLIEYVDNSVIAQLGLPDMRIPIQYAITYPKRYESPVGELSLAQIGKMTFFEPDYDTFKCLRACNSEALQQQLPTVLMRRLTDFSEKVKSLFLKSVTLLWVQLIT